MGILSPFSSLKKINSKLKITDLSVSLIHQVRSTINNLITLKKEISTSLLNKQKMGMISFDIAKANDTVWRPRILDKLNRIISKGNMIDFISNLLEHRTFQVKIPNTLSDTFSQDNVVVQGSSISVTLFLIAINDISEEIKRPNIPLLYADDFTILCRSSNITSIHHILQDSTNKLLPWSKTSGFRFSLDKTNIIVFNHKSTKSQSTSETILNIIKTLAHTSWGAQSQTLLKIHKAIILSKLDYGAPIFSTAKPTHLKNLEPIHNVGIRLSIDAFRSSPIKSILNIAGIPSLAVRWKEQTVKLATRISRSPQTLTHHPKYFYNYLYVKYDLNNIIHLDDPFYPLWHFSMNINLDLYRFPKNSTCPNIYRNLFKEICSQAHRQTHIYSDASSKDGQVGMAIICVETVFQWKLSNNCSIYTAEALTIFKAIEHTLNNIDYSNITIFSDSLSTLKSIQNYCTLSDIARKIQNTHYIAQQSGKNITYTWIPGHCNILGNEQADKADSSPDAITLPLLSYNDIKRIIQDDTLLLCQRLG
ncbi:hypothetical protein QTP88_008331 [Uroleucon formosanum]